MAGCMQEAQITWGCLTVSLLSWAACRPCPLMQLVEQGVLPPDYL